MELLSEMNVYLYFATLSFVTVVLIYETFDLLIQKYDRSTKIGIVSSEATYWDGDDEAEFRWCPQRMNLSENTLPTWCQEFFLYTASDELLEEAKKWISPCAFDDKTMADISSNCAQLQFDFPIYWPESQEERDFPLAFVVIGARNAQQVVRLFQAIYRPWNSYCLTYDNDSNPDFIRTLNNLDACFDNIVMPDEFVDIRWAGFSILETMMNCLRVLNDKKRNLNWKYVQVVSWNDYPLKTNEQMVEILKQFNGAQDSELSHGQAERFRTLHKDGHRDEDKKGLKNSIPPGNMIVYKGSMSVTLSREFVAFLFESPIAKEFYEWSKPMWAPEEEFFSTLIHNTHIGSPGSFPGSCLHYYDMEGTPKDFISRFQIWYHDCMGELTSNSCVFGVGDLPKLFQRVEMVAHKVYDHFQPATLYCLAQYHFNKTFLYANNSIDYNYYQNHPAVRYQKTVDKQKFSC